MRVKFFIFPVIIMFLFLIASCGRKKVEADSHAFEMSDVMMGKCKFSDVHYEKVFSDLKLFGKVASDNNKSANVYPVMGGSVEKIYVELGDYVKQGQVLATINSSEVATIQQERLSAIANVALAKKNLQVARDLYAGKLNSEKDVISAQKDLDVAESELSRLYSIYSLGSSSRYNIKAPISGYIIRKDISPNEVLNKDVADILFSIAEIKDVWVVANVNESDISKVQLGFEADIKTISYPDRVYKGKIDKIFNVIDPETKALQIIIKIPNEDLSLKPEMSTMVYLHCAEDRKMLAIPSSSVIFDQNKNWVVVFRSKTDVEVRQVEVYREFNGFTYIESGLKENEKVISQNGLFIYDALTE
jgi:cobalt-zinc-cadmium efflux system membrane fusion protein